VGSQRHAPAALSPRKRLSLVWTGTENLAPTETRSPNRPGRSESLYRLSYPGPQTGVRRLKMQNMENKNAKQEWSFREFSNIRALT